MTLYQTRSEVHEWATSAWGLSPNEAARWVDTWGEGALVIARVVAKRPEYPVGASTKLVLKGRNTKAVVGSTNSSVDGNSSGISETSHDIITTQPLDPSRKRFAAWTMQANEPDIEHEHNDDLLDASSLLDPSDRITTTVPPPCPNTTTTITSSSSSSLPHSAPLSRRSVKPCVKCKCGLAEEIERRWDEVESALDKEIAMYAEMASRESMVDKSSCARCVLGDELRCTSCPYVVGVDDRKGEKVVGAVEEGKRIVLLL